jgi:HEPN domain-containing protein
MPVLDLFSSRAAAVPDVWVYDKVPPLLQVQIANIIERALGSFAKHGRRSSLPIYKFVTREIAHEHGRSSLSGESHAPYDVLACVRKEQSARVWLDVVELSFRLIEKYCGKFGKIERTEAAITIPADQAVEERNERFRRAGFGYRYESGKIIRIDSEFLHQEATRPALALLSDSRFAGANEEFRAAHDHLKAGENRDCAVDALNALESTMKAICDAKGWQYEKGARASDLLSVLRREKLFPEYADKSLDQLLATLKSGLPAVRNESGGHGQGAVPVETPTYVAVYALNLAASKIRLLVEAFKESERK